MEQNQMNAREHRAYDYIKYAAYDLIGGLKIRFQTTTIIARNMLSRYKGDRQ